MPTRLMEMRFVGFEHLYYVEQTAGCEWVFALFSRVNSPDDVEHMLAFRDKKRTKFGYKELRGPTAGWGRNVRGLAANILAKKKLRESLLSADPELRALWKRA